MFLVDQHETLRAKALEAAPDLVGRQSQFPAERLLVDRLPRLLSKSDQERTFWPRESDRGRPDRGIPG